MNYKELNKMLRKHVSEFPAIAGKLALPNTVMLQFRKDESKNLTIQTLLKLIEGLGYNLDLQIKDADGNTISEEELKNKIEGIAQPSKKEAKKTLATIAGVSETEKSEMPEIDIPDENPVSKPEKDIEKPVSEPEKEIEKPAAKAEPEKEVEKPQQPAEVEIDLDDIFG